MEEKNNKKLIILIVVLVLMLCGTISYIVYDKLSTKEEPKVEEKETKKEDNKEDIKDEEKENEISEEVKEDEDDVEQEISWGKPYYDEDGKYNYACYKEDSDEGYGCHHISNLIVNEDYYSAFLTFNKNILKIKYTDANSDNYKNFEIEFENDIVDIVSGGSCAGDSEHVIIDSKDNLYYFSYEGGDELGHDFGQKLNKIEDFGNVLIKVNKGDIKKIYQYNVPAPCGSTHIVYDDSNSKGNEFYKYIEENR